MTVAVVFYYLKLPESRGKLRLTCNLANAAFKKGHKVYVNGTDEQQCNFLNEFSVDIYSEQLYPSCTDFGTTHYES